jgi:hypothetical protein
MKAFLMAVVFLPSVLAMLELKLDMHKNIGNDNYGTEVPNWNKVITMTQQPATAAKFAEVTLGKKEWIRIRNAPSGSSYRERHSVTPTLSCPDKQTYIQLGSATANLGGGKLLFIHVEMQRCENFD